MSTQRISIIVGTENIKEIDAELNDEERPTRLQIFNHPALATLLGPSSNGNLRTMIQGKGYKLVNLSSDGRCDVEPESA